MEQLFCTKCKALIIAGNNFCPNCGTPVKPIPPSILSQIGIYLTSALLPPLGLFPAIRLLLKKDSASKRVGIIAIIITVVATIFTIWATTTLMSLLNQQLNQQLNIQQLGL